MFALSAHLVAPKEAVADIVMIAAVMILVNVILNSFVTSGIHTPIAMIVPWRVFKDENPSTCCQALSKRDSQCETGLTLSAQERAHLLEK